MPNSAPKRPVLLELPPNLSLDQFQTLMNDRIRDLNSLFSKYVFQPADADVDTGTNRIVNLADPKDDLDGVNLRTLRKFQGAPTAIAPASAAPIEGQEAYAVIFSFNGGPVGGEVSPADDVNELREGAMILVSLSANSAPSTAPLIVNPSLMDSLGNLTPILTVPLSLPIGQKTAVYSNAFAVPLAITKGMRIVNVIVQGGDAADITTTLVVKVASTGTSPTPDDGVVLTNDALNEIVDSMAAQLAAIAATLPTGALILLAGQTASSSASLDFALDPTFDAFSLDLTGLVLATATDDLWMLVSTDGGATYKTTGYDSKYFGYRNGGTATGDGGTSQVLLYKNFSGSLAGEISGEARLFAPGSALANKQVQGRVTAIDSTSRVGQLIDGAYISTSAITNVRVQASSGALASGNIRLYGMTH